MKHDPNPTFKAIKTMYTLSQKVGSFYEEISVSQTIPPLSIGICKNDAILQNAYTTAERGTEETLNQFGHRSPAICPTSSSAVEQ